MMAKYIPLLIAGMAIACPARSADVSINHDRLGTVIRVDGDLNAGDQEAFSKIAATAPAALVVLNSQGGSLRAGLEIGRTIRLRGYNTAVLDGETCASACALAWMAGAMKFAGVRSMIGFHAAYTPTDKALMVSGAGNAIVGAYLNQLGYSEPVIIYATSSAPGELKWLTPDDARGVGLNVAFLDEQPGGDSSDVDAFNPPSDLSAPIPLPRPQGKGQRLGIAKSCRDMVGC